MAVTPLTQLPAIGAATPEAPRPVPPAPDATTDAPPPRPSVLLRIRHTLEAAAVDGAARAVRRLPRRRAVALGRATGWLGYYVTPPYRRVARANVDVVVGDAKTAAEKARIARGGFMTFGEALFGLGWSARLTRDNVRDHVDLAPASESVIRDAMASGRGVIFYTCHYGDWELVALSLGFLATPLLNVAEPLRNPRVAALVTAMRAVSGHQMIPPRHAVVKLFKHLKRGGSVGMLIDVNGRRGRGGAWLDFFGLKVFNSTAVVELAVRTGATILFVHARPTRGGKTEVVVERPVEISQTGDREADVLTTSQRCLDRTAELIAQSPEHWLWSYKRWKRRPTPERGNYPFYSKYDANT